MGSRLEEDAHLRHKCFQALIGHLLWYQLLTGLVLVASESRGKRMCKSNNDKLLILLAWLNRDDGSWRTKIQWYLRFCEEAVSLILLFVMLNPSYTCRSILEGTCRGAERRSCLERKRWLPSPSTFWVQSLWWELKKRRIGFRNNSLTTLPNQSSDERTIATTTNNHNLRYKLT